MLVFDLPDYSKSSPAQNEKLARERQRREEGILQGPDIHAVSPLSRILPPSPRASRRFGVAVMSESEETQSGQLLMWQLRRRESDTKGGKDRGKWEDERRCSLMMSSFTPPTVQNHSTTHVYGRRSNVSVR